MLSAAMDTRRSSQSTSGIDNTEDADIEQQLAEATGTAAMMKDAQHPEVRPMRSK